MGETKNIYKVFGKIVVMRLRVSHKLDVGIIKN
jgi:hypothetical protein